MHARPRPFHLGQQVSREAEADIGPDQDPTNNILPAANVPNQDRFDDGVQPQLWALNNCQASVLPVLRTEAEPLGRFVDADRRPPCLRARGYCRSSPMRPPAPAWRCRTNS